VGISRQICPIKGNKRRSCLNTSSRSLKCSVADNEAFERTNCGSEERRVGAARDYPVGFSPAGSCRENTTYSRWALARALICRSISPKYFFTEIPQRAHRLPRSAPLVARRCSRKPVFTRIEIQCRVYHAADKPVKRGRPARKRSSGRRFAKNQKPSPRAPPRLFPSRTYVWRYEPVLSLVRSGSGLVRSG